MSDHYTLLMPEYARQAFWTWYSYGVKSEIYEAFAGKWGGLEYEHFLRALKKGEGDDHFCAMFALSASPHPESGDVLLPFLQSQRRDERCVSAIALGKREDERAYPFLEKLLLEGLSLEKRQEAFAHNDQPVSDDLHLCDRFRSTAVQLLETWHSPTLVTTMRQAFQALWTWDKVSAQLFNAASVYNELLYTLGYREDFAILDTLDFPPAYRRIVMVYLALGALQVSGESTLMRWMFKHNERAKDFLVATFHLDRAEAESCIQTFHQQHEVECAYKAGWGEQAIEEGLARHFITSSQENRTSFETLEITPGDQAWFSANTDEAEVPKAVALVEQEPTRICFNREHTEAVWSLAWSPDGTRIASGSLDTRVQIWDAQTGKLVRFLHGHTACVTVVAWSPDGQWIASGGSDNKICVWNARTGETITTYTEHSGWICNGLAWSPDSTHLASASWDGSVHIWEAMTGKTRLHYREHRGIVTSVAWSPDGSRVASGGGYPECAIHVWDAFSGQRHLLYQDHMQDEARTRPVLYETDDGWEYEAGSIRSLAWSYDGQWIASAGLRHVFRVWDARSGANLIAQARKYAEGPLAWSTDSRYLATSTQNGVDFWSIVHKRVVANYTPLSIYPVTALAWSPDMHALVSGVFNGKRPRTAVWKVDFIE